MPVSLYAFCWKLQLHVNQALLTANSSWPAKKTGTSPNWRSEVIEITDNWWVFARQRKESSLTSSLLFSCSLTHDISTEISLELFLSQFNPICIFKTYITDIYFNIVGKICFVFDFILHTACTVDACALASILPSLSLIHMIYCTADTKATPTSVQGVGVDF